MAIFCVLINVKANEHNLFFFFFFINTAIDHHISKATVYIGRCSFKAEVILWGASWGMLLPRPPLRSPSTFSDCNFFQ